MYEQAGRAGAEVVFGAQVEGFEEDRGGGVLVRVGGGVKMRADLVVAADGARSRLRDNIVGEKVELELSHTTTYGLAVPREVLGRDAVARRLLEDTNLNLWKGPERHVVGKLSDKRGEYSASFSIEDGKDVKGQRGLWDEVSPIR